MLQPSTCIARKLKKENQIHIGLLLLLPQKQKKAKFINNQFHFINLPWRCDQFRTVLIVFKEISKSYKNTCLEKTSSDNRFTSKSESFESFINYFEEKDRIY